jgi:hypothetical protein
MTLDNKLMEPKGDDPPRRLRVVEWTSVVPAIAICTACAERFTVPVARSKQRDGPGEPSISVRTPQVQA